MSTMALSCSGGYDVSGTFSFSGTFLSIKEANTIYLDTETMSFTGLCYLIQFSTDKDLSKTYLIKVLKEKPKDICALLELLATKTLVIHNAQFDLFHLSKLYTLAKMVKDFSFESLWEAERIFRPAECSYEERLSKLQILIPENLIDTMILARHRFPLAEEFIEDEFIKDKNKGAKFKINNIPEPCLPALQQFLKSPKAWSKIIESQGFNQEIADYYNMSERIKFNFSSATEEREHDCLKIYIDKKNILSLKSLAKFYDFPEKEKITSFEFLNNFPQKIALKELLKKKENRGIPTIPSKELYESLYNYCRRGYLDASFLEYAARDIQLLHHVYLCQFSNTPFDSGERVDFALIPYLSAIQLYGLKIDKEILKNNRESLSGKINPKSIILSEMGLSRPTAPKEVLTWLRNIVKELVPNENPNKLVPSTGDDVVQELLYRFPDEKRFETFQSYKKLEGIIKFLPRDIDVIFPDFNVYGTITHRMTAKNPNPQQMPKDERARSHFCPPIDFLMLIGDYSNLEMRIMGYKFGVKSLIELFDKDEDAHAKMASEMFYKNIGEILGKALTIDESYAELLKIKSLKKNCRSDVDNKILFYRDGIAKTLDFQIPYGASVYSMATDLRKSKEEMESYLERYFKINPELKKAIDLAHNKVNRLHFSMQRSGHKYVPTWNLDIDTPISPIINPFGVKRGFTIDWACYRLIPVT